MKLARILTEGLTIQTEFRKDGQISKRLHLITRTVSESKICGHWWFQKRQDYIRLLYQTGKCQCLLAKETGKELVRGPRRWPHGQRQLGEKQRYMWERSSGKEELNRWINKSVYRNLVTEK